MYFELKKIKLFLFLTLVSKHLCITRMNIWVKCAYGEKLTPQYFLFIMRNII